MSLFNKLFHRNSGAESVVIHEAEGVPNRPGPESIRTEEDEAEELIAVLTAAVAAHMGRSADQIVIRQVLRVADGIPPWARAGLADQMHMRGSH